MDDLLHTPQTNLLALPFPEPILRRGPPGHASSVVTRTKKLTRPGNVESNVAVTAVPSIFISVSKRQASRTLQLSTSRFPRKG